MFKWACIHKFELKNLKLTGIKPSPKPDRSAGRDAGYKHFCNRTKEDAHTKRVQCTCSKCGKIVYAHCGLYLNLR